MSANTFTLEAAAAANIQVVGSDKGSQAVHDLIVAYQANRRTGSANSKTRAEVSGNNKKIFRQKGTGNARHGDKRARKYTRYKFAHIYLHRSVQDLDGYSQV